MRGRVAAGSSSGGLGLKKSGRVGPAALNGAGQAVIPSRRGDLLRKAAAVVASGSGEDIMKTQASMVAARHLYDATFRDARGVRREVGGGGEEGGPILQDVVVNEFLRTFIPLTL